MREFDEKQIMEKYERLKKEYVNPFVPDLSRDAETRFIKDNEFLENSFSRAFTPHICKGKLLFNKDRKAIPKNADSRNYLKLIYDGEGRLLRSEYDMGGVGSTWSSSSDRKNITFCVSDNLWIDCMAEADSEGKNTYNWVMFEWSEYDDDGRLVSVERFKGDPAFLVDVVVNAEYYEYTDGVLSHITEYKDFHSDLPKMSRDLVMMNMPDRVFNPDVINYSFERSGSDIICTRVHYFRVSQSFTDKITIPDKELIKMKEHGIRLI